MWAVIIHRATTHRVTLADMPRPRRGPKFVTTQHRKSAASAVQAAAMLEADAAKAAAMAADAVIAIANRNWSLRLRDSRESRSFFFIARENLFPFGAL